MDGWTGLGSGVEKDLCGTGFEVGTHDEMRAGGLFTSGGMRGAGCRDANM